MRRPANEHSTADVRPRREPHTSTRVGNIGAVIDVAVTHPSEAGETTEFDAGRRRVRS